MEENEQDRDKLSALKNLIIDMDGVLYRGQQPLAGAKEFLNYLQEQSVPFILATNNSTLTPGQYVAKLKTMGIRVTAGHILTSGQATAIYLSKITPPKTRVYVIGEQGLFSAIREQGFLITDKEVDFVVVGLDFGVTYDKLKIATMAIRAGASFIGTNPDTTLPTERGLIPGTGAILSALEAATGATPLIIGKPQPILLQLAMEKLGATPDGTAIIGDRLETDILGGREVGLTTVLVVTGISDREELERSPYQPDLVFEDIGHFYQAWLSQQKD